MLLNISRWLQFRLNPKCYFFPNSPISRQISLPSDAQVFSSSPSPLSPPANPRPTASGRPRLPGRGAMQPCRRYGRGQGHDRATRPCLAAGMAADRVGRACSIVSRHGWPGQAPAYEQCFKKKKYQKFFWDFIH